jgi:hypothetical protein
MSQESNKAGESQPTQTQSEHQPAPTSVQPIEPAPGSPTEPAGASLTGSKDAAQHQVLNLNVEGEQAQRHPDLPAGQHATGSFTDEASKETPKDWSTDTLKDAF